MNLSIIAHIWNVIVESNTFNFIIFAAIIVWVFKKINGKAMISSLQEKIAKLIEDVKNTKQDAETKLRNSQKAVEYLPHELEGMMRDAGKSAKALEEKILSETESQVQNIYKNAEKIVDAEEKMLISKLTKGTSLNSVKIAEDNVKNAFAQDKSLHEKYINESIDELDRLSF